MTTRMWAGIVLPALLFLLGCADDGGNGGATTPPPVAYVANSGSTNVSAYLIDAAGSLGQIGTVSVAPNVPSSIAISPNGSFAFVATNNGVYALTINATTGLPTVVGGSPFSAGTNPNAVTVSPNGKFLYVANGGGTVSAYRINSTTGELTSIGAAVAAGTSPSGVTVSPDGSFLYVSNQGSNNVSAYTITAGSGALVPLGGGIGNPFLAGTNPRGVTVSPNGQFLYVANGGGNVSAYTIVTGSGVLVPLNILLGNPYPAGTNPTDVTISPDGQFLYVANGGVGGSGTVSAYSITPVNGILVPLVAGLGNLYPAGTSPSGLTISPDGQFLYVANGGGGNVSGYRITTATGALTSLGTAFPAGTTPVGIATPGRP